MKIKKRSICGQLNHIILFLKYTKRLGSGDSSAEPSEGTFEKPAKVEVGKDLNNSNDSVFLKKGPFGYYFEWEKTKDTRDEKKKKPKRLPVPKFIPEPSELTIENQFIHILSDQENQWRYRPELKTEADLWDNFRNHLNRLNTALLEGKLLTDVEFDRVKVEFLRFATTKNLTSKSLKLNQDISTTFIKRIKL